MSQVFEAASLKPSLRPAFVVEKLEGEYTKTVAEMRDSGKGGKKNISMDYKQVNADRGWLVTFPGSINPNSPAKPNSIHIETMEEMKRMGFDRTTVPLIDSEGDHVGSIPNVVKTKRVNANA